jgi:hypothetical protein
MEEGKGRGCMGGRGTEREGEEGRGLVGRGRKGMFRRQGSERKEGCQEIVRKKKLERVGMTGRGGWSRRDRDGEVKRNCK